MGIVMFLSESTKAILVGTGIVLMLGAIALIVVATISDFMLHVCPWMFDHQEVFIFMAVVLFCVVAVLGMAVALF